MEGSIKAIIYARVSSEEQVKMYSLNQQFEALREYCRSEGIEVFEEVADEGYSGASLERPGLDRVRDIVETGAIDLVLAQDRDRITREPAYFFLLNQQFEEHNTKIRALNQKGDDSPEGQLTDGIIDQIAKFERAKIAERTRRGRLRKAKEGKVVGAGKTNYGFTRVGDYYEINPEEMEVMTRIFTLLSEGKSLYETAKTLNSEGIKSPRGNVWDRSHIRPLVFNDVYKPHSIEELTPMVSAEVISRLDPSKKYGVLWYSRFRRESKTVSEMVNGEKVYKQKTKTIKKPRTEWVAIPVPYSGISRTVVDKARDNISENQWLSKNGGTVWELTGGIGFCGECGRRLTTVSIPRKNGAYNYYRCSGIMDKTCKSKNHRAEPLEDKVIDCLKQVFGERENYEVLINDLFDSQIKELSRRNPDKESKIWAEKITTLDKKLSNAQDLTIEGLMSKEVLREKTNEILEERKQTETELEKLQNVNNDIQRLEHNRKALLNYNVLSNLLDREIPEVRSSDDESVPPDELGYGASSEHRHQLYKQIPLKVYVFSDGDVQVEIAGKEFSKSENTSGTPDRTDPRNRCPLGPHCSPIRSLPRR